MVYVLAASFVHHAIDAFNPERQSKYKDKFYAMPSLCLNPYAKNLRKVVQTLLPTNLKDKTEIVVWHGVLNNSVCKHKSNSYRPLSYQPLSYRPLSLPDLINVVKNFLDKLTALV